MSKGRSNIVYRILRKIVLHLKTKGVFDGLIATRSNLTDVNIEVGEKSFIEPSAILITPENSSIVLSGANRIGRNVELQPLPHGKIKIGYGTSIQDRNIIIGDVEFGRYCLTAPNVYISSGRHYFDLYPHFYIRDQDSIVFSSDELRAKHSQKVVIEDDVWLGINAVIMSGVTIGRGSIIGSNSVVTKDVAPFSIVAGAPARLIKHRLALTPKSSLHYLEDQDLPNFYKGFLVNLSALKEDRLLGGISATKQFTVYMTDAGSILQMTLKKITNHPVRLKYASQEIIVDGDNFQEISFRLERENFHSFSVLSEVVDEQARVLIVSKLSILN